MEKPKGSNLKRRVADMPKEPRVIPLPPVQQSTKLNNEQKFEIVRLAIVLTFILLFALLFIALGHSALLEKIFVPIVTLIAGGIGYQAGYKKGKKSD
ncbi:MAG: hypothetical protein LBN04_02320 [Oscillospiraceae bacterium]|jgi:hypothetical protein|nr:hypothetical protein [Oscillospiraceae bacterium]